MSSCKWLPELKNNVFNEIYKSLKFDYATSLFNFIGFTYFIPYFF